ncbi:hypothetical protein BD410DRAFT_783378 [Rickenella mellea]|uniref:Yeast cell wall synthesis Kre9/Knh1-like N-terminal domain-containing protein n=1 Tax=Rickenella mellea TaxID=50990 RepID=A0A4Y7QFB8_9AGAM|nr:hypothetical protein BD410DRAFT_783378 [Rickenella mellea]
MFAKFSLLVAASLPFVACLSVDTPSDVSSGGETKISWTGSSGDPSVFSIELLNTIFHNAFAVANNVQTSLNSVTFQLPSVPPGDGYTINLVNISDINQVYAASGSFSITGPSTSSSVSSSLSSTSSRSSSSDTVSVTTVPFPSTTAQFGTTVAPTPTSPPATTGAGSSGTSGSASASGASLTPLNGGALALGFSRSVAVTFATLLLGAIVGAAFVGL